MTDQTVVLTTAEIMEVGICGVMRQVENIKNDAKPAYGADDKADWQLHVEGCGAERAVAKYLNLYWPGKGRMREPDVGGLVEVRSIDKPNNRLILHEKDADDKAFCLVYGLNGTYTIKGWIWGKDGKREDYWSDPGRNGRPAFFVPNDALNPPETLRGALGL